MSRYRAIRAICEVTLPSSHYSQISTASKFPSSHYSEKMRTTDDRPGHRYRANLVAIRVTGIATQSSNLCDRICSISRSRPPQPRPGGDPRRTIGASLRSRLRAETLRGRKKCDVEHFASIFARSRSLVRIILTRSRSLVRIILRKMRTTGNRR